MSLTPFEALSSISSRFVQIKYHDTKTINPTYQIHNIESWLELVDDQDQDIDIYLVQAHGNWEARLAASSVSVAKGYRTIIIPEHMCWECFGNNISTISVTIRPVIVIV